MAGVCHGTLSFPAGSASTDWLVMYLISTAAHSTPAGWTQTKAYTWTAYAYRSYVFTRQKGADANVAVAPVSGGAVMVAYQNTTGIGAVGTFAESTHPAYTLALNAITPQHANSIVLGMVADRDVVYPVPPGTFTSRLNFNTTYFGQNVSEKAYGSTASTGSPSWGQSTTYPAAGILIELLPLLTAPAIVNTFSPGTIVSGSVSTLTFNLTNPKLEIMVSDPILPLPFYSHKF